MTEMAIKIGRSRQLSHSKNYKSIVLEDLKDWIDGRPEIDNMTKKELLKYPIDIHKWLFSQYDLAWWNGRTEIPPDQLWQDVPLYKAWTNLVNSIEERALKK